MPNAKLSYMEAITLSESKRLCELEAVVTANLPSCFELGKALAEIRDCRLYRSEFDTFADYCRSKWDFTDSRARQLIAAAEVQETVTTVTLSSERAARELGKVDPDKREEVAKKAAATGKVTAKSIKEAARFSHKQSATTEAPQSQAPCGDEASSEAPEGHGQPSGSRADTPKLPQNEAEALAAITDPKAAAIQLDELVGRWIDNGTKQQLEMLLKHAKHAVRNLESVIDSI